MTNLGKFDKASKAPIIRATTTDVIIVACLLSLMFIFSGGMAEKHYRQQAAVDQEVISSWGK